MDTSSKEITAQGKLPGQSSPVVLGSRVIDRLLTSDGVIDFPRKQYLLLQALRRDIPIEEAALKLQIPLDEAMRFRETAKAQEYLQDREIAAVIAHEAQDKDRWWVRMELAASGALDLSKAQTETLREMGRRIAPVSAEAAGNTQIEINIGSDAIEQSKRRRESIDSQIVTGENAA